MRQKSVGFRDLLERLLPVEELPPVDRLRVERALRSGLSAEVERAAFQTIELLESQGALRRLPEGSGGPVARYQTRNGLDVITVQHAGPAEKGGVFTFPRASLPAQAAARLDQVRRLVRLDDPMLMSDPRSGPSRAGLLTQLDLAGRELLGATYTRFHPAPRDETVSDQEEPVDEALLRASIEQTGSLFHVPDTDAAPAISAAARRRGLRSLAVVAVADADGRALGALEVGGVDPRLFRPIDLALAALLADCCATALERAARIESLVFVDALTSVYNRAYFDLQLRNEMARAQREQSSMALVIVDIDDFKSFNTSFGYEAGNQVLVQVAHSLRGGVRPFDTVARWGGEEFAVLLTAPVVEDDVLAVCERLRVAVERLPIRLEGLDRRSHRVNVTCSSGVAMFPEHADNPQELWRLANQALLQAKRPPKNQVVFWQQRQDRRTLGL